LYCLALNQPEGAFQAREIALQRRAELTELMDDPNVNRAALAKSLRFIRRVNRYLGGTRAVMGHFQNWSHRWKKNQTITILDVATGSADIPLALLKWSHRNNFDLHIIGLDLHAVTLELAQQHIHQSWPNKNQPPIHLLRGDALALPFANQSIDYVTCSMFLHHLNDQQVAQAVAEMVRVARRGIVINDLLRSRPAQLGIFLLTLFADPIDKHDARVSVKKAWIRHEVEAWKLPANAPWLAYHEHIPARFTLAGERP
jgi:ubiquinone/menaquinone biosynthesis C-methylase UbiE